MFGRRTVYLPQTLPQPQPIVVVPVPQALAASLDPVAVGLALKVREAAAEVYVAALADYLAADAEYRDAFNAVYIAEGGPEHLRKVTAEDRASDERAARDVAEVAKVAAEQSVRLAELGFRAAMGGAPAVGES